SKRFRRVNHSAGGARTESVGAATRRAAGIAMRPLRTRSSSTAGIALPSLFLPAFSVFWHLTSFSPPASDVRLVCANDLINTTNKTTYPGCSSNPPIKSMHSQTSAAN
ncbi:hypothetical protein ILYODFUR_025236, partial [Ilyodon furcidens]